VCNMDATGDGNLGEDDPSVFGQLLGMPSDDIEKLAAQAYRSAQ
jgi:hypothetical protein